MQRAVPMPYGWRSMNRIATSVLHNVAGLQSVLSCWALKGFTASIQVTSQQSSASLSHMKIGAWGVTT
jgi:hypothetical protein